MARKHMTIADHSPDNPFFRLDNDHTRADLIRLALVFRCVHYESAEVWACCRFDRARDEYQTAGISGYLGSPAFAAFIEDGEVFPNLDILKSHAEDYLAARIDY